MGVGKAGGCGEAAEEIRGGGMGDGRSGSVEEAGAAVDLEKSDRRVDGTSWNSSKGEPGGEEKA